MYFKFNTIDGLFNFFLKGNIFGPSIHLFHPWKWEINTGMQFAQLGLITIFWR